MMVGPTKVIPAFLSAALRASDSGVLHCAHTGRAVSNAVRQAWIVQSARMVPAHKQQSKANQEVAV